VDVDTGSPSHEGTFSWFLKWDSPPDHLFLKWVAWIAALDDSVTAPATHLHPFHLRAHPLSHLPSSLSHLPQLGFTAADTAL
jgi:hypothetical protein